MILCLWTHRFVTSCLFPKLSTPAAGALYLQDQQQPVVQTEKDPAPPCFPSRPIILSDDARRFRSASLKASFSIPFSRLVMALFAFGLMGTAIALFWITYLGSLSIAEHEIARSAKSKATLARLVFTQHLDKLETQIRAVAPTRISGRHW